MRRMLRKATPPALAAALLASTVVLTAFPAPASAQESDAQDAVPLDDAPSQQVRIEARRLENGRTEFALRPRDENGLWTDALLPDRRFFPVAATAGRWLVSGPIALRLASEEPGESQVQIWVRITARRLADDRIEFGLQRRTEGGRWADRLLPARRFFPTTAEVGRWLVSSPVTVTASPFDASAAGGGGRSGETLLAASFDRTCAVQPDGGVSCWGREGTRERLSASVLDDVLAVTIGDSTGGAVPHLCRARRRHRVVLGTGRSRGTGTRRRNGSPPAGEGSGNQGCGCRRRRRRPHLRGASQRTGDLLGGRLARAAR